MKELEPCPYCSHESADRVKFTPWGGIVGPFVLSLVKCTGCGSQYNGKSGNKVERAIRLYTLVTMAVLVMVAAWAIYTTIGPRPDAPATPSLPGTHQVSS